MWFNISGRSAKSNYTESEVSNEQEAKTSELQQMILAQRGFEPLSSRLVKRDVQDIGLLRRPKNKRSQPHLKSAP